MACKSGASLPLDKFPQREALTPDNGSARHSPIGSGDRGLSPLSPRALADAIREAALGLGFARVGFCPIEPFARAGEALRGWLERGLHGDMA